LRRESVRAEREARALARGAARRLFVLGAERETCKAGAPHERVSAGAASPRQGAAWRGAQVLAKLKGRRRGPRARRGGGGAGSAQCSSKLAALRTRPRLALSLAACAPCQPHRSGRRPWPGAAGRSARACRRGRAVATACGVLQARAHATRACCAARGAGGGAASGGLTRGPAAQQRIRTPRVCKTEVRAWLCACVDGARTACARGCARGTRREQWLAAKRAARSFVRRDARAPPLPHPFFRVLSNSLTCTAQTIGDGRRAKKRCKVLEAPLRSGCTLTRAWATCVTHAPSCAARGDRPQLFLDPHTPAKSLAR
jgi:hypothetical protein